MAREKPRMKILVTGSSGSVGMAAVKLFVEKDWEVIGIDNNMRSMMFNTPWKNTPHTFDIDIREEEEINKLFREQKFDAIIHAAAQPSHDWSKKYPLTDFDINARGTLILLEATRKHCPDATFVFVSTDKVYGENMMRPVTETITRWDSNEPFAENLELDHAMRSPFGCSKLAADIYVQEYGLQYGLKTVCFRAGCITGRNHEGAEYHGFLAYLAKCIKEEKTYRIFGYKGKQVRDQIHAEDLASAFWHFIENPKVAEIYNIGGGPDRSVSILEAIRWIETETGKKAITEYIEEPRKGDRIWDVHDVTKFRRDYPDWDYKYDLKDIIHDVCQKSAQ